MWSNKHRPANESDRSVGLCFYIIFRRVVTWNRSTKKYKIFTWKSQQMVVFLWHQWHQVFQRSDASDVVLYVHCKRDCCQEHWLNDGCIVCLVSYYNQLYIKTIEVNRHVLFFLAKSVWWEVNSFPAWWLCALCSYTVLMTAYRSNYSNSEEKTHYLFIKLNLLCCLV